MITTTSATVVGRRRRRTTPTRLCVAAPAAGRGAAARAADVARRPGQRARVGRVGVRLTDENGPRGGVDKRCALRITVPGQQPIVIEQQESNLYLAIDSAAERAGRAVSRQVGRQQALRRDSPWQDLSQ